MIVEVERPPLSCLERGKDAENREIAWGIEVREGNVRTTAAHRLRSTGSRRVSLSILLCL